MKKFAIFAALLILVPMTAFGAKIDWAPGGDNGKLALTDASGDGDLTVGVSNGVEIYYDGVAQGYLLGGRHLSGTRTYGTSSGDTGIFYQKDTNVSLPTTVPTGTGSGDFSGSWETY